MIHGDSTVLRLQFNFTSNVFYGGILQSAGFAVIPLTTLKLRRFIWTHPSACARPSSYLSAIGYFLPGPFELTIQDCCGLSLTSGFLRLALLTPFSPVRIFGTS